MFTKMLVATDLSEASEKAICTLAGLKQLGTKDAHLVECFNIRDVGTLAEGLMQLSKPSFDKQIKLLEHQGFRATGEMVLGLPHIEINRVADEHDCSLIVIGSHGRTMAGEVILGGVASAVIHSAVKPVLLIRLRLKDETGETICESATCDPLNHILFPTDFSDNAEYAFSYLQQIADCGARRITLLHVQDKTKIDPHLKHKLEEFNQIDTERLQRLKSDLEKRGVVDVRIQLLYGLPKKEIVDQTKQSDFSLVIMGSRGRGFVSELFLGSVSHAVARHSEVPVMLISMR